MFDEQHAKADKLLIEATIGGDERAFSELAARHKSRVFALVARFARNPADLDDICQEVFIQVFFKLRQYRFDAPFEHWLLRIATFKCYDYLRKNRCRQGDISVDLLLEEGYQPAAPGPPASPDLERFHTALARLPPKERLVITLLELEERSAQEVADLTGWSAANVRVRAFRARASLRQCLERMT